MDKERIEYYQNKINQLGEWYQPIVFIRGVLEAKSKYRMNSTLHGIYKWNFILRRNLPLLLSGKKILDVGCASGLYSMMCAREGAEVIALELDEDGYQQSLLTREIFSELDGKDYSKNFQIFRKNLMEFEWDEYPKFDVVMALNVLYWITIPYMKIVESDQKNYSAEDLENLIKKVREHSQSFLVQADENKYFERKRKGMSLEATDSVRVEAILRKSGYLKIRVDKPFALQSLLQTAFYRTPEIDFKKPLYYARPIVKAES